MAAQLVASRAVLGSTELLSYLIHAFRLTMPGKELGQSRRGISKESVSGNKLEHSNAGYESGVRKSHDFHRGSQVFQSYFFSL
jgi:hypothetical protein